MLHLIELTKYTQVHCTRNANGRHLETQTTTKICIKLQSVHKSMLQMQVISVTAGLNYFEDLRLYNEAMSTIEVILRRMQ